MVPIHWSAADLVQFTNHIMKFKCKIGENRGAGLLDRAFITGEGVGNHNQNLMNG